MRLVGLVGEASKDWTVAISFFVDWELPQTIIIRTLNSEILLADLG